MEGAKQYYGSLGTSVVCNMLNRMVITNNCDKWAWMEDDHRGLWVRSLRQNINRIARNQIRHSMATIEK